MKIKNCQQSHQHRRGNRAGSFSVLALWPARVMFGLDVYAREGELLPTLSDFNSVFEVALGVNAILVYFDLSPRIEDHFKKLLFSDPGPSNLKTEDGRFIEEADVFFVGTDEEKTFVRNYGWRLILLKFTHFKSILLFIALINSLAALALLIIASFYPSITFSTVLMGLILIFLFMPVSYLTVYYYISFPRLKKCAVSEARKELSRRKEKGASID